ncbi:hypothetical protein FACS189454_06030 [Planctomycetales bacterium]|nr:hypothetical protein FACS189454_06030 [Planctomycetales bacterium]
MMKKYEPFVFFARHGFDSLLFRNSFLPGVWKNTEKSFWYCGWPGVASGFFLSDGKNVAAFSKRMNYNYIKHNNTVEHKLYQVMIDKDEYFIKHITSLHCGSISGESLVITTDDDSSVGNFDYWSHKLEWKFFDKHSHVLFLILIAYGFMRPQP